MADRRSGSGGDRSIGGARLRGRSLTWAVFVETGVHGAPPPFGGGGLLLAATWDRIVSGWEFAHFPFDKPVDGGSRREEAQCFRT
jgi:hypothetical protein